MSKGEIILVIDGSETAGNCVTLMLSFIWGNYAIPLAWLTREDNKGDFPEQMHLELLKQVYSLFASAQRVVLLGMVNLMAQNSAHGVIEMFGSLCYVLPRIIS